MWEDVKFKLKVGCKLRDIYRSLITGTVSSSRMSQRPCNLGYTVFFGESFEKGFEDPTTNLNQL